MIEVLIPVAIVAAMLLVIVVTQSVALSQHKKEIERLRELAEQHRRTLMRNQGTAVEMLERERDGMRRIQPLADSLTGTALIARQRAALLVDSYPSGLAYRHRERLKAIQEHQSQQPAPQAQADSSGGLVTGIMIGHMLGGGTQHSAPPHDDLKCPPQAPSVESTGPSPSCEAPSTSSGGIE